MLMLAYTKECGCNKNKTDTETILQWAKKICNLQLADDQVCLQIAC
jgi:hypothetical protein